ncbi:GILT-like protein 1 [Gryllus bimaculatus]|nr:GILT-like protein 1 [Gryllus bimaculatus]
MVLSPVVRVKLVIFAVICFVLWQAIRTVPSSTSFEDAIGDRKYDQVVPGAQGSIVPVKVTVFYESLCPDSRSFITKQLLPSYEKAPRLIDPVLVPYGKAETQELPDGSYRFTCQHGPLECQGNKVHACGIANIKDKEVQLKYIACMISDNMKPEAIGLSCAETYGVPWDPILKCSQDNQGDVLLKHYGEETHDLSPAVSFIPTILLNGYPKPEECS